MLLTVTVKNTHKTAAILKRDFNKNPLYIRSSTFVPITLFPNVMAIGTGVWL